MNTFVFVVCGEDEHIQTLNFSLHKLKKFTKNEIIVITDLSRNKLKINHNRIINVPTSKNLTHHQASIFLKTSIYKYLPSNNNYCYLDSDVIALNNQVDSIFNEFVPPIIFAPDHCIVKKFSPYAVNCGCKEKWELKRDLFNKVNSKYDKNNRIVNENLLKSKQDLLLHFDRLKHNYFLKIKTGFRYFLSSKEFHLNKKYYFDKKQRFWVDKTLNEIILYESPIKKIEKETGFKYNTINQKWYDDKGNDIWKDECKHLSIYIKNKFKTNVSTNWQHWNGGVFLFNDYSHSFLEAWHSKTIAIFSDKNWRTRDQGTLIATANEFNLEKHKILDKKWNFIADYNNQRLRFKKNGQFTDDNWKTSYSVNFLHIYHHWGDENWSLWNWVANS